MAKRELSKEEIRKRLIRLQNLEKLHTEQKIRIERLIEENKKIVILEKTILEQQKTIDDLKLQIEELRTMIFGKKKKIKEIDNDDDLFPPKEEKIERTSDSYKRPIPRNAEVTETISHTLSKCNYCHGKTTKRKTVIFYEEDIPIPSKKIVRKHIVEKVYCPNCKKWQTDILLPSSKVILGKNVQKYVCYLSVLCRLSFTQIQNVLQDTYQIHISQGELAKILNREAVHLRPFYEQLKAEIREEPVIHLDETGWKLLIDGSKTYSWVMSGGEAKNKKDVFLVGESRGKGNAKELLQDFEGSIVTDGYAVYGKLIKKHQLCWAHLIRKFRDLARSEELEEKQRIHCKREYMKLCLIFNDLKNDRNIERYNEFTKRLKELSMIKKLDLKKLIRYKTTLRKNIPEYLTCLSDPRIPLTNNQAERSLRHLVLKKKISFGSLTKRTADNLAVLMSVLMSLKQEYQNDFFGEYLKV